MAASSQQSPGEGEEAGMSTSLAGRVGDGCLGGHGVFSLQMCGTTQLKKSMEKPEKVQQGELGDPGLLSLPTERSISSRQQGMFLLHPEPVSRPPHTVSTKSPLLQPFIWTPLELIHMTALLTSDSKFRQQNYTLHVKSHISKEALSCCCPSISNHKQCHFSFRVNLTTSAAPGQHWALNSVLCFSFLFCL